MYTIWFPNMGQSILCAATGTHSPLLISVKDEDIAGFEDERLAAYATITLMRGTWAGERTSISPAATC